MKKIIAVLLLLVVFTSTGMAYAAGNGQNSLQEKKQTIKEKVSNWNIDKGELKERAAVIREKHAEVKSLRSESRQKIQLVKNRIKDLKKNPDGLTEAKVTEISEKLALIRTDKSEMAGTWGKVAEENLKLKTSKKNKDYDAALANLDNIIRVLDNRIEILKKTNSDLDALLAVF